MPSSISNDGYKSKNQLMIDVFMSKMRSDTQHVPPIPLMPSLEVRKLRARLMLEECLETINAGLGLNVNFNLGGHEVTNVKMELLQFTDNGPGDLIQVADGCADVEVVTTGTASACGIALQPCFDIVMPNNLMKFAPGHTWREDGKLVKPPNHPDIALELKCELIRQGWRPK
ncbi:MAG: hypothetical protein GZ088_16090 [Acidipila sp.]|nr:hypothetical protein [Acidipila sp.]